MIVIKDPYRGQSYRVQSLSAPTIRLPAWYHVRPVCLSRACPPLPVSGTC